MIQLLIGRSQVQSSAQLAKLRARRSLHLVMAESAITAGSICTPIMTPFFHSLALTQAEIALSQALFTIAVALLNLPAGWVADRFGRKWANVAGDLGAAVAYFLYAGAQSFLGVVFCECLLGGFIAFSQGVDLSLVKHFTSQLEPGDQCFRRKAAQLSFWQEIASLLLVLLGGPIGAFSFRIAIAGSGFIHLLGGLIGLGIFDDSERLTSTARNPFRDIARIARDTLRNPALRRRIWAYAIGREMTHGIIWVYTPMLMLAGVPLAVVSLGWVLNSLACVVGTRLALRFSTSMSDRQAFNFPLGLGMLGMAVLAVRINIWTIGCYLLVGIAQGWSRATLLSRIQKYVAVSEQTTVVSLAKVVSQTLYVPTVCLIGWAADFGLNYAALATIVIFLPLGAIVSLALKK